MLFGYLEVPSTVSRGPFFYCILTTTKTTHESVPCLRIGLSLPLLSPPIGHVDDIDHLCRGESSSTLLWTRPQPCHCRGVSQILGFGGDHGGDGVWSVLYIVYCQSQSPAANNEGQQKPELLLDNHLHCFHVFFEYIKCFLRYQRHPGGHLKLESSGQCTLWGRKECGCCGIGFGCVRLRWIPREWFYCISKAYLTNFLQSLVVACAHTLSGDRRLETQNFECRTGVDGARIMWWVGSE